ncbi:L,D-transpeptidase family protein [Desertimonas flava]|uniref:L,D-transpeptidase family protein n=1 Tax=Desertimonas flava TaxID=2064846 RepID=UPI0013C50AAA|nr:L,D-transpeptidase family protein [Desertimonas flava]
MHVDLEARLSRAAPALDAAIEAQLAQRSGISAPRHTVSRGWRPLAAAAAVVVITGAAAAIARTRSPDEINTVEPAAPGAAVEATTTSTTTTQAPSVLSDPIGIGTSGPAVEELQRRLTALGFVPGPIDGEFGVTTQQAVWAFEKLVLATPAAEATGVVTDEMWQRMQAPIEVRPRRAFADGASATRSHTEIYLAEQVVVFFVDDEPALISHISTGSGEEYREVATIDPGERRNESGTEPIELGLIGTAVTPGGVFEYSRLLTGMRQTPLGEMYDPAYFNETIAIHGASDVPLHPVSHGGVRVPLYIGERFHEFVATGDQVFVFDGVAEPEDYGAQPPVPDRIDPAWSPPD